MFLLGSYGEDRMRPGDEEAGARWTKAEGKKKRSGTHPFYQFEA